MGQKMVRFAQLGAARSRQDESIEVGEVGSKRPSLGGNGWGAFRLVGWADLRLVVYGVFELTLLRNAPKKMEWAPSRGAGVASKGQLGELKCEVGLPLSLSLS
jgi:hypothetical protein